MRVMARAARAMGMAMKRVIARKRAMASYNDNKMMATETMLTTTTTKATNTTMTTLTLTMMMKTTTKTEKTLVRWWRLAVASGGRGGQQMR
jgi:hypothetical protein